MSRASISRRELLQLGSIALTLQQAPLWAQPASTPTAPAVALLVGNTSYNPNEEDLPPAKKCLIDLAARLQRLGFETALLHDPTQSQLRNELERMGQLVTALPATTAVFYFVGHGFQSKGENFLVPAGSDLNVAATELAQRCLSVERDVFFHLQRSVGSAANVIMIDACRTVDRPRSNAQEGHNQTMPPEGCHVAFATGPGQRAFAPADPQRYTFFAEALINELDLARPDSSVLKTLEGVSTRVQRKVNSIDTIRQTFGKDAQQPEIASNVTGDPTWIPAGTSIGPLAAVHPALGSPTQIALAPSSDDNFVPMSAGSAQPQSNPEGDAIAQARNERRERAQQAATAARLSMDQSPLVATLPPRLVEEVDRALKGDKYAALRVALTRPLPLPGELIERTDYGRWMAFAAYLGNGIAAHQLSLYFRNVDHRDAEAARYLKLARAAHYTPPPQLDPTR